MKPALWFRIAAALFLLFAAGHTYGFLTLRPSNPEGRAVLDAMNNTRVIVGSSTFTYGGFYLGFGLFITLFQLFTAWLCWHLGSMSRRIPSDAQSIAWAIVAVQVIGLGLSWKYFSIEPAVLSALTALCLALGAISTRRQAVMLAT
jgi:hypothetical protein